MIKADGTTEQRRFGPRRDAMGRLARLADELEWLQSARAFGEPAESDDSDRSTQLRELASRTSEILRAILNDRASEHLGPDASESSLKILAAPSKAAPAKLASVHKIGARNSGADQARIQSVHDTSVELGANCDTNKSARGALEKRFDMLAQTLADVLQRLKNIEDQPLPLPFLGPARAVSKTEDSGGGDHDGGQIEKLLANPEALSVLAIKLAQRKGRSSPR
jgi:hypothetical protein